MLVFVAGVALAVTWLRGGAEALARNRLLLAECDRLSVEQERLQRENLQLRRERAALGQDTYYIERVIREDRGLLAPGEVRLDPLPPAAPPVRRLQLEPPKRTALNVPSPSPAPRRP
ncbi:MAG: hypothetical protein HYY93_11115, partial [Planctomycetes bacterium]|nr:hypothetical protein [Planctomycetota bacterium]